MGCDSHPYIEKRRKDGTWVVVDDKHRYYKYLNFTKGLKKTLGREPTKTEVNKARDKAWKLYEEKESRVMKILGRRNYTMFGVIAGVRDGEVRALFDGRGLPEDASDRVRRELPDDSDYHSHTFFTLKELMDVDPNEVGLSSGSVCLYPAQYQEWKEKGEIPAGVEDYAFGREVTSQEMDLLLLAEDPKKLMKKIRTGRTSMEEGPYVRIGGVPRTYKSLVPELFEVVPLMQGLTKDPEGLRVVIAFDN